MHATFNPLLCLRSTLRVWLARIPVAFRCALRLAVRLGGEESNLHTRFQRPMVYR